MFELINNFKGVLGLLSRELGDAYPTNSHLNYNWSWGSLAGIFLVVQICTGIILGMFYIPTTDLAFESIEYVMRDVNCGWLVRYMHANGASFYFISIYCHMANNIYYKLYLNNPNVWITGMCIFVLSMATAFIGYILPWGQMSYWGATVITNLFSAIPLVGGDLVLWLWGGFSVGNPTLHRFFSLHYCLPFVIVAVVLIHLFYLHNGRPSSSIPLRSNDKAGFYPFFALNDFWGVLVIFWIYFWFVFFAPNALGHTDNYIEANPLVTPLHIVPEWYFLPFYAMLRAIPNNLGGVICMAAAIVILFFLPVLDSSNSVSPYMSWVIAIVVLLLGWLGSNPIEYPYDTLSVLLTLSYFWYWYSLTDRT